MLTRTREERAQRYRADMLARIAAAAEEARKRQRQPPANT